MTFKKTLIFSGCSFVAGDEVIWEKFITEELPADSPAYKWTKAPADIYNSYVTFRKQYNMPAQVGKLLNSKVIDVSRDGNSNSGISLGIINTILSIPKEEYKNLHVCAGWTVMHRRFKWVSEDTGFKDINIQHYKDGSLTELDNYIFEEIVKNTDYDHVLHYIKDVLLLEYFLKSKNISYTFWRSLRSDSLKSYNELDRAIKLDNLNDDNWVLFDTGPGLLGKSWVDYMDAGSNSKNWWLSPTNGHPGMSAIKDLSLIICNHILKRNAEGRL